MAKSSDDRAQAYGMDVPRSKCEDCGHLFTGDSERLCQDCREETSKAAAALGRAGRGACKVRGNSEHYRALVARRWARKG